MFDWLFGKGEPVVKSRWFIKCVDKSYYDEVRVLERVDGLVHVRLVEQPYFTYWLPESHVTEREERKP